MGPEIVTMTADGQEWSAFEKINVHASFEHAVRSFKAHIAAEPGAAATAWTFKAGTAIDILFNGDLAFRGYVDRYQPRLDEHKTAAIDISGRSKGQDFTDSSAMHDTGEFRNRTPEQIAKELDKFDVGISADVALDPVELARIVPGETAFRCIEKLCRMQGVFMVGQADGSIKITTGGKARHAGGIYEGINLKSGSADHNWSARHSHVHVRGQRAHGSSIQQMQIDETSQDEALHRYRPVVVSHDADITPKTAQKRAKHRRNREAGRALRGDELRVQGFRDDAGVLWTPGNLIWVECPFLGITQDMAIESVRFMQDRHQGSESVLSICDPRALGGSKHRGGKANAAWDTDAGGE